MRKAFASALLLALTLSFTANQAQAQSIVQAQENAAYTQLQGATNPSQAAGFVIIPYIGYNIEDIVGGLLIGIGVEFVAPFAISNLDLSIMPSAEYVFSEDFGGGVFGDAVSTSVFQVNGDVIAKFAPSGSIAPFAGAGLAIVIFNVDTSSEFGNFDASSTDIGLNLLGGVTFPGAFGSMEPYVMGRLTLADGSAISIIGGLRVPLGAN